MMIRHYKGWAIYDNGKHFHPVTGRFQAVRYGVTIGADTQELLISMIDTREERGPIRGMMLS